MTYYTDDANKVEYDMDKAIEKITIKIQEDQDNFIFGNIVVFPRRENRAEVQQTIVDRCADGV